MADPSSSSPVHEGDVILGKYRVEKVLGMGGMGVVVAAMHLELEQRVALKFLLASVASDEVITKRFTREARAAAKIHSEHVARVMDVGTLESGSPFIVMEYMDGEDLEKVLRRDGPLAPDMAVTYVLQACEAIAEAHALGIVHRDLKPANLFLAKRPSGPPIVKVSDFGISKAGPSMDDVGLTQTASLLGSPAYMAPEQMTAAKDVDTRVDVWALGIVLYELIAGHRPFNAPTMPELVVNILHRPPEPIGREGVPQGLDLAIRKCLEKLPADRFQNVAQLAATIAPFGSTRSGASVERISHVLGVTDLVPLSLAATLPATGPSPSAFPRSADEGRVSAGVGTNASWAESVAGNTVKDPPSRAMRVLGGALLVGVSLGVGGGIAWVRGRPESSSTTTLAAAPPPAASAAPSTTPWVQETASAPSTPSAPPAAAPPVVAEAPPAVVHRPPHVVAAPPTPPRKPATAPATPQPAPETPKPSADKCHIVSSVDVDGTERFKKVCN